MLYSMLSSPAAFRLSRTEYIVSWMLVGLDLANSVPIRTSVSRALPPRHMTPSLLDIRLCTYVSILKGAPHSMPCCRLTNVELKPERRSPGVDTDWTAAERREDGAI